MTAGRFLKKARKTILFLVNIATIVSMTAGPVLASAPSVVGVTVSETSIQVQFDQAVNTSPGGNPVGDPTSYADDLRNYSFEYPAGTPYPLVTNSPYSNWIGYVSGENATSTINIYGMNLTQGINWHMDIQGIGSASSTPEIMLSTEASGTVVESADPVIDTVSPLYALNAENATTTLSFIGDNFPTATSTAEVFCRLDGRESELEVVSVAEGQIDAVLTIGADESNGRKDCYIRDTDTNKQSLTRPVFLYSPESYGVIYGTIKDVNATSTVDKVEVEAYASSKNWERFYGISQADGKFAVAVPAGTYNVSYRTPGAGSTGAAPLKSGGIVVAAGAAASAGTVNFVEPTITGHVYAINGTTPLYHAALRVYNQNWTVEQNAYTGADGSYKLYATPSAASPQYTIEVTPSDYDQNVNRYLATADTVDVAAGAVVKNIRLSAPNVSGIVKTPADVNDSNPFPDTTVPRAAVRITDNASYNRQTNTDNSGAFSFAGIAPGTYSVELEAPYCGEQDADVAKYCGYVRTRLDGVVIGSGSNDLGTLRFHSPNFFGYVFADANGNGSYDSGIDTAIANAQVSINNSGFSSGVQTNSLGRYAFSLPNTGSYNLNVQPIGNYASYSGQIQVSSLPSGRDIALSAPNLTGYVLGPSGEGQPNNWVELCPYNAPGQCYGSQTGNDGSFSINVPDGQWQMRVNTNWSSFYLAPSPYVVVVAAGRLASVTKNGETYTSAGETGPWTGDGIIIGMIDPASDENGFNGTVYAPDGVTPQSNIGLGLRPAAAEGSGCRGEGVSRWTQTNQSGRYAYSEIAPGLYEIEAIPWGDSQYSRVRICHTVDADDDSTRTLNIDLTSPNMAGTVKTPDGETSETNPDPDTAIANGWVSLMRENSNSGGGLGGNTNESGIFNLGGIGAGVYTLEINPGWGSVYSTRRFPGITIDANGNCATAGGGDADPDDNACDFNTLANVGDGTAVRVGIPNLYGTVVVPDGDRRTTPVQNAWVMVHNSNWAVNSGGNTDSEGSFRVGGLDDGTYQIEVNMPWGGQQAYVLPGGLSVSVENGVGTVMRDGEALEGNVIILTEPTKTISGTVQKDGGGAVNNARVSARMDMGGSYFETTTNADGGYELKVSGGNWWVEVKPDYGLSQPDWIYSEPSKRVVFAADDSDESKTADFTVLPTNSTIIGTVKTPANDAVQGVWIEIRGTKGMGSGGQTDVNGRFSINVPAGTYNVNVFNNSGEYGSPDSRIVTVAEGETTDAGTLNLKTKNSHITGFAQDDSGNALSNVVVNAQLFNGSGWAMTYTDQTGAYDLPVWAGTWNVMVMPMSQSYIYQGAPLRITIADSETSDSNNFQLKLANKTLKITVRNQNNDEPVTDIWGGVWVKDTTAGMIDFGGPMTDMMDKSGMTEGGAVSGQGMEKGGFMGGGLNSGYTEIKVPSGTFELGIGMPPGSRYTLARTEIVTVGDEDESIDVDLLVKENLATISGQFYLFGTQTPVTDIRAFINADMDGGGWQSTQTDQDGSYALQVSGGDWFVNAFVDSVVSFGGTRYMVINDNVKTTVADDGTAVRDFEVKPLDSTISGTVTDPDEAGMGGVWVFADFGSGEMVNEFKGPGGPGLGVFTAADGTYELNVPAGTYKIGAGVPPWDTRDLLNPEPITVAVTSGSPSSGNDMRFMASDATISGQITLNGAVTAGYVRGWSDSGRGSGAISDNGSYELKVTQGDTWHVMAVLTGDNRYYESAAETVATNAGAEYAQNLALAEKDFTVPDGVSVTFDSTQSKTIKLTNGGVDEVVMEIPAGAIASSGTITVSITPTVDTKPDSKDKPIGLSYEFEARDADGNKIENFSSDITIYIKYDPAMIADAGYSEDSITPKYYDTATGSWENYSNVIRDTDNDQLIIKTNHFSTGGITGGNIPAKPTNLAGTGESATSITLTWSDNSSNETGFKVYRGSTLIETTDADVETYTDEDLEAGSYSYYVKATNAAGDSAATDIVTVETLTSGGEVPDAPADLAYTDRTSSSITLSWTDNSNDETGFKVYRSGRLVHTTGANATSYADSGLHSSTAYSYYVKAYNASGNSTASNTLNVSTKSSSGGSGGGSGLSGEAAKTAPEKPVSAMSEAEMMAKIAELQQLIAGLQAQLALKSGGAAGYDGIPAAFKFTEVLKPGMQGVGVRYLQIFLKAQGAEIYPQGLATGYFGPMTKTALIKFQEKYATDILASFGLVSGTGIMGSKTMAKINALMGR